MKIITKDNFGKDLFEEEVIAKNVNEWYGKEIVKLYNEKNWNEHSDYYLALVEDDYKCYNGYELYM